MHKHHKSTSAHPDPLNSWQTWLDHQYDPGYWPSTGRVPPSWHILYGCLFALMASVFLLASIGGLLMGTSTSGAEALGGLVVGGLLLAWSVRLVRKARLKRSALQRHRRRERR